MKRSHVHFPAVIRVALPFVAALATLHSAANAATFVFNTDPFAGSTALTTPGRQVVGGESTINPFSIATDVFVFDPLVFGISGPLNFANGTVGSLPTTGVNAIVLQTFDDDGNAGTPFGAGNAANLIAAQLTSPGPGFFIYFNSGLELPRLVYSTDLNDNTADLKILARLGNLTGDAGRTAMSTFTSANFQLSSSVARVPEPAGNLILVIAAGALLAGRWIDRRRTIGR